MAWSVLLTDKQLQAITGGKDGMIADSNPEASLMLLQEHARDTCLAALERAGLKRTQQGSAIVLTATEPAEEIQLEHFSQMSVLHFAKLYTVSTNIINHAEIEGSAWLIV